MNKSPFNNYSNFYDFLVNNRSNCEYRLNNDAAEKIKNYVSNKAKVLFQEDILENSRKLNQDINMELLNKFSNELFNKNEINFLNNNSNEKRIICRTPKTKRNYITFLLNNKDYDSLLPNEKIQCQMYRECILHRENELKNYAKQVEITNNMFNYISNKDENLREVIKQKEEQIEEFSKEIVSAQIKGSEKDKKISDFQKEINELKNKEKNDIHINIKEPDNSSNNNDFKKNKNDIINNNDIFKMEMPIESNNSDFNDAQSNSKIKEMYNLDKIIELNILNNLEVTNSLKKNDDNDNNDEEEEEEKNKYKSNDIIKLSNSRNKMENNNSFITSNLKNSFFNNDDKMNLMNSINENNRVNPFLGDKKNGFNFMANNSNKLFTIGLFIKK